MIEKVSAMGRTKGFLTAIAVLLAASMFNS